MIIKCIVGIILTLCLGLHAMNSGYGPYIGLIVMASLFALPSLGNRITGVKS